MEAVAYRQFRDLERVHWWFRGRRAIFEELLRRRILPATGKTGVRSLDLGCGVGGNMIMLAEIGDPIGIDVEIEALRMCHDRGFRAILQADGQRLPFADGQFAVVTALDAIEHIPDDAAAFRECARVLKPGGFLLLSGPAYQFLYTHQDAVVHHCRRYTLTRVRDLARKAGLRIDHASYINFLLFPAIFLAILGIKLAQWIRPPAPDDHRSNASIRFPRWLNEVLARVFSFERHIVPRFQLPFGHSLIMVARKADGSVPT